MPYKLRLIWFIKPDIYIKSYNIKIYEIYVF